jgi:AcrR family transcriptional regulator
LAILQAARRVFAEKGFDGATTRELAQAAGVSEALMYKHFPSKESLFDAMRGSCAKSSSMVECRKMMALEASTSTLIVLVHFLMSHFVRGCCEDPIRSSFSRLMTRSLLEDGDFARQSLESFADTWLTKFEACLRAAAKAGELREIPVRRDLRLWFSQHIGVGVMLHLQPKRSVIDYRLSKEALVEQAVWFALLGIGLEDRAITRHYNPKALALMAEASPYGKVSKY